MQATQSKATIVSLKSEVLAGLFRGWSFTPCRGKQAFRSGWQAEAPLSEAHLLECVERGDNIGLRTGPGSGVFVVDFDAGAPTPEELGLPETVTCRTGSGGLHCYFKWPKIPPGKKLSNTVSKLADHVDTRGDGGYVVFPGSFYPTTGRQYKWERDPEERELADLPQAILERLLTLDMSHPANRRATEPRPATPNAKPGDREVKYQLAALTSACDNVRTAPTGQRNHTLNEVPPIFWTVGRVKREPGLWVG